MINIDLLRGQFNKLTVIAEFAVSNILQKASRNFLNTASKTGFLRGIDVVGGGLHQAVLGVGKFVGFKFKPWQAVNFAKNLGNFAMMLGPILAGIGVAMDFAEAAQESKKEQEMADARRQITSQFLTIAKDLEHQIEIQFSEFDVQFYGKIEQKIAEARKQNEEAIASSNTWMNELITIRQEFEAIIKEINPIK